MSAKLMLVQPKPVDFTPLPPDVEETAKQEPKKRPIDWVSALAVSAFGALVAIVIVKYFLG